MNDQAVEQWYDILPPEQPQGVFFDSFDILLLSTVTIALLFFLYKRVVTVKAGLIFLKLCLFRRLNWVDNKHIAYELGYFLSLALRQAQLRKNSYFPLKNKKWSTFLARLDEARYGTIEATDEETDQLLDLTGHWLSQTVKFKIKSKFGLRQIDQAS